MAGLFKNYLKIKDVVERRYFVPVGAEFQRKLERGANPHYETPDLLLPATP